MHSPYRCIELPLWRGLDYARLREVNEKIVKMDETAFEELLPLVEQGVERSRDLPGTYRGSHERPE